MNDDKATLNIGMKGRLKHGDLLKAMEDRGWNQAELGKYLGMSPTTICALINLRWVPQRISKRLEQRLVELTGKLPEDLWPEWSKDRRFLEADKTVTLYKELTRAQLADKVHRQLPATPEEIFQNKERTQAIQRVLKTLTKREELVINERFENELTLAEVGAKLGVGPERVRQIEARAFRKLRHRSRTRILRSAIDGIEADDD